MGLSAGATAWGSPPRLRGALIQRSLNSEPAGITPAPAGSTSRCTMAAEGAEDHPRACGEHLAKYLTRYAPTGSPPRLRGALW